MVSLPALSFVEASNPHRAWILIGGLLFCKTLGMLIPAMKLNSEIL
jgi:hypothetical protein